MPGVGGSMRVRFMINRPVRTRRPIEALCDEFSGIEESVRRSPQFGATGLSVARFGAAASEVAPQR
jgi:hypothetical protein